MGRTSKASWERRTRLGQQTVENTLLCSHDLTDVGCE